MNETEEQSPLRRLLDSKLRGGLDEYVELHRSRQRGWPWIAQDLYAITGVRVTDESLRRWYREQEEAS